MLPFLGLVLLTNYASAGQFFFSSSDAPQVLSATPTYRINPAPWQPTQSIDQLEIDDIEARSLIVVDATTGKIWTSRAPKERVAIASVTKIMTAAIVLEFADPASNVKISPQARQDLPLDSAVMGVSVGETYTVKQLLYGLLLPSGNDAAQALAIATAGSRERFVSLMNGKAVQLGMHDTHFTNASGLDDDGHYSSAYDLAILTKYAMSFPLFREIVSQSQYDIPYSTDHKHLHLVNANSMIGSYEGATGVKPGNTANAGNCLVASASRNGHDIIGVLLDTPGRNTNMAKLFDRTFARLTN